MIEGGNKLTITSSNDLQAQRRFTTPGTVIANQAEVFPLVEKVFINVIDIEDCEFFIPFGSLGKCCRCQQKLKCK
ncbi:MAG TPA: hypothetical protein DCM07_07690 [Planctomycetaceae bacterium]|nr:hypothetical protein [Planctomycetaceae bacterium]